MPEPITVLSATAITISASIVAGSALSAGWFRIARWYRRQHYRTLKVSQVTSPSLFLEITKALQCRLENFPHVTMVTVNCPPAPKIVSENDVKVEHEGKDVLLVPDSGTCLEIKRGNFWWGNEYVWIYVNGENNMKEYEIIYNSSGAGLAVEILTECIDNLQVTKASKQVLHDWVKNTEKRSSTSSLSSK